MTGAVTLPGPEAFGDSERVYDTFEQLNRNIPANTKGEVSRIDERIDGNVTLLAEYKASIDENAAGIAAGAVRITDLEANLVSTKYVETIAVPSTVNLITHDLGDSQALVTVYGAQPDTLTATSDDSTTVGYSIAPGSAITVVILSVKAGS